MEAVQESGIPSTIFPQIDPVRETGLPKSPQMGMGRIIAWRTPRQLWDDQSHLTKYGFPWFSRVFLKIHPWINVGKYAKIILMPVFPHFPWVNPPVVGIHWVAPVGFVEDPNVTWDRHFRQGCAKSLPSKTGPKRCPVAGCKEKCLDFHWISP